MRYVAALVVSLPLWTWAADPKEYRVDCPAFFLECAPIVTSKLVPAFIERYPASAWKIVVPNAYVMRLGNGSLRGYFTVAVWPIDQNISTNDFNSTKPVKRFGAERRLGTADLKGQETFRDEIFRKLGTELYLAIASEATEKMIVECQKTPQCAIYEP